MTIICIGTILMLSTATSTPAVGTDSFVTTSNTNPDCYPFQYPVNRFKNNECPAGTFDFNETCTECPTGYFQTNRAAQNA